MPSLPIPSLPAVQGSAREWILAVGGGLALSTGIVALLRPSAPAGVETTAATAAAPTAPPQSPPPASADVQAPPASSPAADISGLILRGVMGAAATGSAIIEFPGGRQARFPVGREVVPGVVLKAIEPQSALLSSNGSDVRLALPGADVASLAPAAAAKDMATSTADPLKQTIEFRAGLQARKRRDGRITGFVIQPDSNMPAFAKAGLKPGDVVVTVNGRAFASEAEVDKLANEIKISRTVVFGYERNGKISEARLSVK